jgi:hypothetical protein
MRIITTELDQDTINYTYVCYACHYRYDVDVNHKTLCETVRLGPSDNGNKPFIQLLDKQLYTDDYNRTQTVNLYACPRCMTVQLCEQELDD